MSRSIRSNSNSGGRARCSTGDIDNRVDDQIAAGLVDEVRGLLDAGYEPTLPSFSSIGYRQLVPAISGEIPLAEAVERIKLDTHRLVRHQQTWARRNPRLIRIDMTQPRCRCRGWSIRRLPVSLGPSALPCPGRLDIEGKVLNLSCREVVDHECRHSRNRRTKEELVTMSDDQKFAGYANPDVLVTTEWLAEQSRRPTDPDRRIR